MWITYFFDTRRFSYNAVKKAIVDKYFIDIRQIDENDLVQKNALKQPEKGDIILNRRKLLRRIEGGVKSMDMNFLPGGTVPWGDAALGCMAGICAATDLWCGKVFNAVTAAGLLLGLGASVQRAGATGILEALCAIAFTILVLFPFYRAGGIGAGDIKLLAAVSAFLPSEAYLRCFAAAFAIGAVIGIARLLWSRGKRHTVHFAVAVAASVLLHLGGVF